MRGDQTQHFCPAMLPTGEEEKGWNNECESGELCQSVNRVIKKKKVPQGRSVKSVEFPSKYQIYVLHGRVFLWALFDLHNLSLEYLFSSAKPLVRGQCSALKSHIAVCKPRR